MKRKVFISFRFSDGNELKENLVEELTEKYIINKSEEVDRSTMSDDTIWKYLKDKIADSSVTICVLTPDGLSYNKKAGKIDDWLYDEHRFSLTERSENKTSGMIALYTEDSKDLVLKASTHKCDKCNEITNTNSIIDNNTLLNKNNCNVKSEYKECSCDNLFDQLLDSYVSFIHIDYFLEDPAKYIDNAIHKKEKISNYDIVKLL